MDVEYQMLSLADMRKIVDESKPISFDTETIGLYGRIRLAQFYQSHWDKVVLVEYPNAFELAGFLNNMHTICHNSHYDITCVQEGLGKQPWMPAKFDDTFLLARLHFYEKDGFSLDAVANYVYGYNPYEGNDQQQSDWSIPVLSDDQLKYAAMDAKVVLDIFDVVKDVEDSYSYKLDLLMTRYCLDFQNNGMPVDIDKLNETFKKNTQRIDEIALPINCNSYKQVRAYIGSTLSDDLGLAKLSYQGNERAVAVRETRKLTKSNSFLTKFLNTMVDGCIYGKFKVSARSGRTASDDQNLQQLPRSLKGIFGVDEDGDEVIVFSDFPQIQLRAVCAITGDTTMSRLFREGKDLHNYVADMTFGENFTDEHRQIAKTENFGLLFGAGVVVFGNILLGSAGIYLNNEQLTKLKKKWLGLFKEVAAWQTKGIKDWKKGLAWSTPLGRKYTAKMMTDQLATQIQGFEAEVAKLAYHYMQPHLKELNDSLPADVPKVRLRNFVHDCYLFTCWKDEATYKRVCEITANAMQEAWVEMCKGVAVTDLPLPIKVRVGYNWGDIDKKGIFIYEHVQ